MSNLLDRWKKLWVVSCGLWVCGCRLRGDRRRIWAAQWIPAFAGMTDGDCDGLGFCSHVEVTLRNRNELAEIMRKSGENYRGDFDKSLWRREIKKFIFLAHSKIVQMHSMCFWWFFRVITALFCLPPRTRSTPVRLRAGCKQRLVLTQNSAPKRRKMVIMTNK